MYVANKKQKRVLSLDDDSKVKRVRVSSFVTNPQDVIDLSGDSEFSRVGYKVVEETKIEEDAKDCIVFMVLLFFFVLHFRMHFLWEEVLEMLRNVGI